jgi:acyl-coenzyme A synthetase/AMP-(fatty) acid ligase
MTLHRLYDWAQSHPDKPALIYHDHAIDYGTFARIIERTADWFVARGTPRGGLVAVLVADLADGWVIQFALRRLGLTTIFALSTDALCSLRLPNLSAIVTTSEEAGNFPLPDSLFSGVPRFITSGDIIAGIAADPVPAPLSAAPDGGHIIYTSGTTGRFKQVLIDGPAEIAATNRLVALSGASQATMHHGIDLAIRTTAGYRVPLAVWHAGGTVVFDQRPDRFQRFFSHPVTHAYLPGPWVRSLLDAHPRVNPQPGFWLVHTSGFLSPALAAGVAARFGSRLSVAYGASELGARALTSSVTGPNDLHWLPPSPGRLVAVVDEQGRPCPTGGEGALRIRCDEGDATSYVGDPEATAGSFRDGFFYSGDRAVAREDGRIRILGRMADLLNVNGRKVAAAPVEQEVRRRLGLEEICLFSGLAEDGEEELVVAVEGAQAMTAEEIAAKVAELVVHSRVRALALPEFPRTDTRKIKRAALRDRVF